ncbi:hypothetical protein [Vagococcus fluvialis]|uniref:hypothetical protein n=1 Tax=Vagococcus fluvialis TaxID=2738 RepID=UPI003B599ECC
MDKNIEIGLIDFFRDDEWSQFYKPNHRDKILSKGHSEFRGNMKDRTLRLLSTYYHEPIKLIGKKDEKKLVIGRKREIQLPNSNHASSKLIGANREHYLAVEVFKNYIVKLLNQMKGIEISRQFIDATLLKSKKGWLASSNIIMLTKEAFSSNLIENNYLSTEIGDDLKKFSAIYYKKLSKSQQSFFDKIEMMIEGQIDFKERYFCDYDSSYTGEIYNYIFRNGKKIREISSEEYSDCIKLYNSIKKQDFYDSNGASDRLDDFQSEYGFRRMWTEYQLDYEKLIDKDFTTYLYTDIKDPIIKENIFRHWLWNRYDKITEEEFRQNHIKDKAYKSHSYNSTEFDLTVFSRRRVYLEYSMKVDKTILLPLYIKSIEDIQTSFMKVQYTLAEYKYLKDKLKYFEDNIYKLSFVDYLDNNYLAKKYQKIIEKISL